MKTQEFSKPKIMSNWQKIDEKYVYEGYRRVLKKTFRLPNETLFDFDIIDNWTFVTVAALTENQEVILVEQFRPGPEKQLISFAEGKVDAGELPLEAARRELLEETGYAAGDIFFAKEIPEAYTHARKLIFIALNCRLVQAQDLDNEEFIRVFTLDLEAFKALLRNSSQTNFTNVDAGFWLLDYLQQICA
ncbi:MAG: NUDIX hydrolase [Microscillaceae bacterium]|nr:NUDIX hydrolase [Microscillaceae bacterium]